MVGLSLFGVPFLLVGLGTMLAGIAGLFASGKMIDLGGGLFMILFSLPFVAVGVGLTIGTWVLSYLNPYFVRYALSNKRAYIATSWWYHKMESYPIDAHNYTALEHGKEDTVYFIKLSGRDKDGDRKTTRVGFEHIADGAAVYALLRDIQQKAKT